MTAKELKSFLNNSFKEKLSPLGFKKTGSYYTQNNDGHTFSIMFNSLNYDNSYPTSFSCLSGFLIVDKILRTALGLDDKEVTKIKVSNQIFVRQVVLWEQKKYPCKNYDLYTLKEAENAVTEMLNYFLNAILPELRDIKSLNDLDKRFNAGDYMSTSKRLKLDIMYGLIVAKLVSNPNYDSIRMKYQKITTHFSDWDKQELNNVIQFLDSNSIESITPPT